MDVVIPGMLNCAPFKSTSEGIETALPSGAGDGVVEAGSTASSSAWGAVTLFLLVLLLLSRWLVSELGERSDIPGNRAFASLNFVGSGDLTITTSCRHSESRGRGYDETGCHRRGNG